MARKLRGPIQAMLVEFCPSELSTHEATTRLVRSLSGAFLLGFGCPQGFESAGAFHKCWQPL